jgi:hypothetical protein
MLCLNDAVIWHSVVSGVCVCVCVCVMRANKGGE